MNFFFFFSKLFRRVAAALPGMDSTPEKSKEDSILHMHLKYAISHIKMSVSLIAGDHKHVCLSASVLV